MTRRVALLTTSYPAFAGDPSGHFVETEARVLARNGARVTVVAPGPLRTSYEQGVEVVGVGGGELFGWPGVMARLTEAPSRALSLPPWALRARHAVERSAADELVAHWVVPCVWPIALGAKLPVHGVSHGTDVRMLLRVPAPMRRRLVETLVARLASWRFVSDRLYMELRAGMPNEPETLRRLDRIATVAPSPVTLPDLSDAAATLRASVAEAEMFVIAARLVPGKRVEAALRWVASSRLPSECRVFVLGDGPSSTPLRDLAAELHINVGFLGMVARREALLYIAAADAVLHASVEEGLSTVVREAEHYRTKVIVIE